MEQVGRKPVPELTHCQFLNFRYKIDDETTPDGCWPWCGAFFTGGYGSFGIRGHGTFTPHRIAFKLATGINPIGFQVAHKCDNRACCNPDHLFRATILENNQDMMRKGRHVTKHGEDHKLHKLTVEDIVGIRSSHRGIHGDGHWLAVKYGVSESLISKIVQRKTWAHVSSA